jgi:hypothetical protein
MEIREGNIYSKVLCVDRFRPLGSQISDYKNMVLFSLQHITSLLDFNHFKQNQKKSNIESNQTEFREEVID